MFYFNKSHEISLWNKSVITIKYNGHKHFKLKDKLLRLLHFQEEFVKVLLEKYKKNVWVTPPNGYFIRF